MNASEKQRLAIIENNLRVLERMEDPTDDLRTVPNGATWFPPRPIIKKDPRALNFIIKKGDDNVN